MRCAVAPPESAGRHAGGCPHRPPASQTRTSYSGQAAPTVVCPFLLSPGPTLLALPRRVSFPPPRPVRSRDFRPWRPLSRKLSGSPQLDSWLPPTADGVLGPAACSRGFVRRSPGAEPCQGGMVCRPEPGTRRKSQVKSQIIAGHPSPACLPHRVPGGWCQRPSVEGPPRAAPGPQGPVTRAAAEPWGAGGERGKWSGGVVGSWGCF